MAAPKELKSPGASGKPQNVTSPVASSAGDIPDLSSGIIPDISLGLVGSAANPPTPETPFTLAAGSMSQQALSYGAPIMEAAASMAPAIGRLSGPAGIAAAGGIGAAASALFDNLKNYTVSDPSQRLSNSQIVHNAMMAGGFSALGEGVARGVLGLVFRKAKDTGNDAIAKEIGQYASDMYGDKSLLETAEGLAMKLGKQPITLTPEEAFPMNPEAIKLSRDVLENFPGIGAIQAYKLGKIKEGMLQYGAAFDGANISNIKDAAGKMIENYQVSIRDLQNQVNNIAKGKTFKPEAENILAILRSEMEKIGGTFKEDVLTFHDEPGIAPIYNIYRQLKDSLSIPAQPAQYSKIVGVDGTPFVSKEATKADISPLSINDINRVLSQLTEAAKFGKESSTASQSVARKVYNQVVDIRDNANIAIAQESGNEALANELRGKRDFYRDNIDGLRAIQENLKNDPSDVIPYLIKKNNPAEFAQIFSVLTNEQKSGLKSEFLRHLIDPVSQRARNIIPDNSFKAAFDELLQYDPKILNSIFSPGEFNHITSFLKLGERVEKFGDAVKTAAAKEATMDKMWLFLANPKVGAARIGLEKLVESLGPKSNVRAYLDARSFMAGLKSGKDIVPAAQPVIERLASTGKKALSIRAASQVSAQVLKEINRQRGGQEQ